MAAARIVDSGTPFVENGEGQDGRRVPIELSRPLAHPAKLAHQIPLEVDHRDLRRLGIEYVKVARAIEGYGGYPAEGVPIAALRREPTRYNSSKSALRKRSSAGSSITSCPVKGRTVMADQIRN